MSAPAVAAPLADGWLAPDWMRCPARCRLVLELDAPGPALQLDFADGVLRVAPAPIPDDRRSHDDGDEGVDQWAVVRTTASFVAAWLHDPDTLLGDTLGQHLSMEGQLYLVSLFDGLVGQYKAGRGTPPAAEPR